MHFDFINFFIPKKPFIQNDFLLHIFLIVKKRIEIETTIILNYHARYVYNQIIFIHEIMNINSATWHSLLPPLTQTTVDAEKAIL